MTERIIIKASKVWDGISDSIFPHGAVLIEGDKIKAVGSYSEIMTAPHDSFIDVQDATLMPGLIDSHTHLSMDATMENYLDHMTDSVAELTLRATAMMRRDLQAGITTCRCLGDKEFLDIACRQAVNDGLVAGPNLLVATRGIRAPHGHGFVGYPFDGVDEIRNAVLKNIDAGADLIKIYITGTLKGKGDLPSYLKKEEIKTAIEAAHDKGIPVASHCVGGIGLDWALELGLDTLEHAYHITDDQIDELVKSKTWLVLTPSPLMTEARIHHLPAALIPGHLEERVEIASRMAAMIATGMPFAVGSDGVHGELVQELMHLIDLGATTLQTLKAATIHGAKACGVDDVTGSLEIGKQADMIAVEGNPFENIMDLRNISAVMKKGNLEDVRVYKATGLLDS